MTDDTPDWEMAAEFFGLGERIFRESVDWVAQKSGFPADDITGRKRSEPLAGWRAVAMARCAAAGMAQTEIGVFFGRDHTTVGVALKRVAAMAKTAREARDAVKDVTRSELSPHVAKSP